MALRIRIRFPDTADFDAEAFCLGTDVACEGFPTTALVVGQQIDEDGNVIVDLAIDDAWTVSAP